MAAVGAQPLAVGAEPGVDDVVFGCREYEVAVGAVSIAYRESAKVIHISGGEM